MSDVIQMGDVGIGRRSRIRLQSVRRTVHVNGLRMSLLDWMGPEQPVNPPVVILHGALQTAEGMANLASHLSRRGRVVVPDLRGRGHTAQPDDGYDPGTMAADVAGLVAALRLDRPVVIGRLHGGLVAYHLAANHPQVLSGLVLGDTSPEVTDGRAKQLIEATRSLPRSFPTIEDAHTFYQQSLGLPIERALHDIPFDLKRSRSGYTWRHNLDLIARIEESALPRSDWDVLARIAVPTLILRGQRGMLSPAMAERMCEAIGDCTVQTILASGRDVFLGGGAEQAFAAIDLYLLRLSDTGLPTGAALPERSHARTYIEPLVRALNGKDAAALRNLVSKDAIVDVIRDQRPIQSGGCDVIDELIAELFEQLPTAVFATDRLLASRREASVVLIARASPTMDGAASDTGVTLYLNLWYEVADTTITSARVQVTRVTG
ncbi:MAG TPA: alpha/beta hydrolase [Thermomicrobiales bacterium]|nr:alpha/beta hydrolase [Thermomicrobiales bacterium]